MEHLKLEISLREEILRGSVELTASTLLIARPSGAPALPPIPVRVLTLEEAYAEKIRAALTRRVPAIRDFYDLDNAHQAGRFQPTASEFLRLVAQKLSRTDDTVDISEKRIDVLNQQIEAH